MFTLNKHFTTVKSRKFITAILIAVLVFAPFFELGTAHAAGILKNTTVRFDRMAQGQTTNGTVCATPQTALIEAHVQLTLPTGFTPNATPANWMVDTTTNTAAWPAGATAWLGIGTATAVAGQVVTFPSTDLVVGTLYCFNFINVGTPLVTTPGSPGTNETGFVTTQDNTSTTIDTEQYATATLGANADTINVTATVPAAFSFALSANSDPLGQLSTASVTHGAGPTATVNTNAKNGWMVWAKDAYGGLCAPSISTCTVGTTETSPQLFLSSAGNSTLVANTEGYNLGVTVNSPTGPGVPSIAATFTGGTSRGGGLTTAYQTVATSTGPNGNAVLTLTNNASISPTITAATDYADTEFFVAAGLF